MVVRNTGKKMGLGKKGMFFTLITLVVISLFILTISFYSNIDERKAIQKRITTLNNFIISIEEDLVRRVYISGFRIILSLEDEIVSNGNYIQNLNQTMNELFFNGSINNATKQLMLGASFQDLENFMQTNSRKVNLNITFSNPSIYVSQKNPWEVEFSLKVDILAEDLSNLVEWNSSNIFNSTISIENFEDPTYLINTNGRLTNKIKKTPFTIFASGSNVSSLLIHAQNSYYKESMNTTNFLQKLQGANTPNQYGIESFVNLDELLINGIVTKDKSVVDYIYFSTLNPTKCNIQGMPSWFKLDLNIIANYQLSGLKYNCQ